MAIIRQLRVVILLQSMDFDLAARNVDPTAGKVLLNEMWKRNDCFFGCAESRDVQFRGVETESLS